MKTNPRVESSLPRGHDFTQPMLVPQAESDPRWPAIRDFDFDRTGPASRSASASPPARPFVLRLAKENGWTPEFARRVCDEYLRFVYLALAAGHPVSPSPEVDEAWHLHLMYTRSYWDHLCGSVLGKPLHHEPSRGGQVETVKFDDWYARTLQSYEAAFGSSPPADIWPRERHGHRPEHPRIDLAEHWVIRKRHVSRAFALASMSLGAVGLLGLASCGVLGTGGSTGLIVVLGVVVTGFLLAVLISLVYSATKPAGSTRKARDTTRAGATNSNCGSGCGTAGNWWWFGAGHATSSSSGLSSPDNQNHGHHAPYGGHDSSGSGGDGGGSGGGSDGGSGGGDGGGGGGGDSGGGSGCGGGCGGGGD